MNKMRYARIAVATAVLLVAFACTFANVPIGTLCALCPVGFAQLTVAGGAVPWGLLPGMLVLLVVVFLLGRVFCSWVCPTSWWKNVFGGKNPRGLTGRTGTCTACGEGSAEDSANSGGQAVPPATAVAEGQPNQGSSKSACRKTACRTSNNLAAQAIVLVVLLVISFVVHFPVFCLVCPIGLTFGALFAVSRMFITWQPGWELVVFPAMLAIELVLLRRWCSAICPLGFFFGLMAKARSRVGFLPRVRVDRRTCLHDSGCNVCATVCPENLSAPESDGHAMEDCTMCLDCREHCPARSISCGTSSSASSSAPGQAPDA